VGSEMCIRDRLCLVGAVINGPPDMGNMYGTGLSFLGSLRKS
jgi:hypothetical protein